ncbi:MAG: DNA polymerase IV [Proteobacteria bacterium]|nr:DNA polymerase IV [Pseudomonadota bacterium]
MSEAWPRTIVHADMDAFYAAIEQLDRPELRGRPILVGHPGKRGVVTTASYEARPFGVGSAMPMALARRRCPQAVVVAPRFSRYAQVSSQVMEVFRSFSPEVEPLSLDEAFMDLTGAHGLFGDAQQIGSDLKRKVHAATGLRVSVGIAATKYVAKVASDVNKPDGLTVVPPSQTRPFLDPLPVSRLWGVGKKMLPRIHALGLRTIADVADADRAYLARELGALGVHIHALAHGRDPRPVVSERGHKSIGHEETLEQDVQGAEATKPLLLRAADRIAARLREQGVLARGVRVKLKTASFRLMTRQRSTGRATDSAGPLYRAALSLLPEFEWDEPMRLVGMAAFQLVSGSKPEQLDLFARNDGQRRQRLDRALDELRGRFGHGVIRPAGEDR